MTSAAEASSAVELDEADTRRLIDARFGKRVGPLTAIISAIQPEAVPTTRKPLRSRSGRPKPGRSTTRCFSRDGASASLRPSEPQAMSRPCWSRRSDTREDIKLQPDEVYAWRAVPAGSE